jgi:hypothetical protein
VRLTECPDETQNDALIALKDILGSYVHKFYALLLCKPFDANRLFQCEISRFVTTTSLSARRTYQIFNLLHGNSIIIPIVNGAINWRGEHREMNVATITETTKLTLDSCCTCQSTSSTEFRRDL